MKNSACNNKYTYSGKRKLEEGSNFPLELLSLVSVKILGVDDAWKGFFLGH